MRATVLLPALALLILPACNGDNDDNATPSNSSGNGGGGGNPSSITISSTPQVQMTIDGATVSLVPGATVEAMNSYSGESATPPALSRKSYGWGLYNNATEQSVFGARIGSWYTPTFVPNDASFFAYFTTGVWPYGDVQTMANKASISWYDADGLEWSTTCGSADQTGSTFQITDKQEVDSPFLNAYVKLRITFSCKLYSCSGSGVKNVTNGVAVITYENL